jgi:hypothetical protein
MKKLIIVASVFALLAVTQTGFAQAVQEMKAAKKEIKAEKKLNKAENLESNAITHKGVEVAGISDPLTRNAKADRKREKAQKKHLKAESEELKAAAKSKKKQATDLN